MLWCIFSPNFKNATQILACNFILQVFIIFWLQSILLIKKLASIDES